MHKLMKRLALCLTFTAAVWGISLIRDRQLLNRELIRLHIVANSDSPEDQAVKLQLRDAILESLQKDLARVTDADEAKAYLQKTLPKLEAAANQALAALGCDQEAVVTLCREAFDIRHYDTFSLPSGVYQALRITIGEGEGHNWWCVAFPSLCLPAAGENFHDVAAGAGFSDGLQEALTGEKPLELRFYLLDALGRLQNRFFDSP